jgi:hypothetical protein
MKQMVFLIREIRGQLEGRRGGSSVGSNGRAHFGVFDH